MNTWFNLRTKLKIKLRLCICCKYVFNKYYREDIKDTRDDR